MRLSRPLLLTFAAVVIASLLSACEAAEDGSPDAAASPSATEDACAKENLKTVSAGRLTMATDQPAHEPWFVNDQPENGQGFEGAVAAAVAQRLGFQPAETVWVRFLFDAAVQPGPKNFDFAINEFSITEELKNAVDFSSPYYDVPQAVITTADSEAATATTMADLRPLKLGAQVGTISYDAILSAIQPTEQPAVFNNDDDAKQALKNFQVDAIVVDLPTAFFLTDAELDNDKIVGQLPPSGGVQEQFGLVLDKGNPLTPCVSKAVDALRSDGTLEQLEQQWLAETGGAPVLQ